jgi:hypothetical protein
MNAACCSGEENAHAGTCSPILGSGQRMIAPSALEMDWTRGIFCDASCPEACLLRVDYLRSDDERSRHWAVESSRCLDTREARKALCEAGYLLPIKGGS